MPWLLFFSIHFSMRLLFEGGFYLANAKLACCSSSVCAFFSNWTTLSLKTASKERLSQSRWTELWSLTTHSIVLYQAFQCCKSPNAWGRYPGTVLQFLKVSHGSLQLQELQDALYGWESHFKAPRSPHIQQAARRHVQKHGTQVCMLLLIEGGHYFAYEIDIDGYYSREATN